MLFYFYILFIFILKFVVNKNKYRYNIIRVIDMEYKIVSKSERETVELAENIESENFQEW